MPRPRKSAVTGPARYMRHRQQFGRTDPGVFTTAPRGEEADLAAAVLQHQFARRVRNQMQRLDLDPAVVAQQAGIGVEQLNRILRGDAHLRLPLMYAIAKAVDITITVNFEQGT